MSVSSASGNRKYDLLAKIDMIVVEKALDHARSRTMTGWEELSQWWYRAMETHGTTGGVFPDEMHDLAWDFYRLLRILGTDAKAFIPVEQAENTEDCEAEMKFNLRSACAKLIELCQNDALQSIVTMLEYEDPFDHLPE